MTAHNSFPAVERASKFVRELIAANRLGQADYLPPVRVLARDAGVSTASMQKALSGLKARGLLHGNERHRLQVGAPPNVTPTNLHLPKWEEKRILVERDMLAGRIGFRGMLPTLKELQARYGVGFGTMKKITAAMVADGIIKPRGKGFSPLEVPSRSFRQKIVYITCKGHFTQMSALNQSHNRIVDMFESESIQLGVQMQIIEIDFYDSQESRLTTARLRPEEEVLGYLVDLWWYDSASFSHGYTTVLARLATFKKPVAILDELGNFTMPAQFCRNPLMQSYSIERQRAGERIGRLLLGLGHHSITYLSLVHDALWSKERYEGLASQYARAGNRNGVHLFDSMMTHGVLDLFALSGLAEPHIRKLIVLGRTPSQARDLEREWKEYRENPPSRFTGREPAYHILKENLYRLSVILDAGFNDSFVQGAVAAILEQASSLSIGARLAPLFEKALTCREATAWVCATDWIAFEAHSFLCSRSVRVPQDISIVGFDNVPARALEQQLTTFDFNAPGFVRAMLSFLFRPPKPRGTYRHETFQIEGIVLERGTTARAKAN